MRRTPDVAIAIAAFFICAALLSLSGSANRSKNRPVKRRGGML